MSITTTTSKVQYTISSTTQTLTVTFPFNLPTDLLVTDGANILVYNSDYTVTGGGYNSINQMLTGSITLLTTGSFPCTVGDLVTIQRNVPLTQTTTFSSTGILTPLMIEQDDDKLTTITQQVTAAQYNPFPNNTGGPQVLALPWITAEALSTTTGNSTTLNSINVTNITTASLPIIVATSISYTSGDYLQWWKLRPNNGTTDGTIWIPGAIVIPLYHGVGQNLVWVRVG